MIRLYLFECKKIFKQRIITILLVLFTILSLFVLHQDINSRSKRDYLHADNALMSAEAVKVVEQKAKAQWAGEMDDAWLAKLLIAYEKSEKRLDEKLIDFAKMENIYGANWYENYRENSKLYYDPRYEEASGEKTRALYYYEHVLPFYEEDIQDDVVFDIYMNYAKTMLINRPWNSEDGTFGIMYSMHNNEAVPSFVYSSSVTKPEILLLKDIMNEKTFYYGDVGNQFEYLSSFSTIGILLLIWMILISSNLINKERGQATQELLSSTALGGSRLFIAKVGAVFTCGMLALGTMVLANTIYVACIGGFANWDVNITYGLKMISIYTYGEGLVLSLLSLVLGVFAISMVGVTLSTFIKSNYISLAVLFLCIFAFNFSSSVGIDETLFPMGFMNTPYVAVRNFTTNLFGNAYILWKVLFVIWIPLCMLLGVISLQKYTSRKFIKIQ